METEGQPLSILQMLSFCRGYYLYIAKDTIERLKICLVEPLKERSVKNFLEIPSPSVQAIRTRKTSLCIWMGEEVAQPPWEICLELTLLSWCWIMYVLFRSKSLHNYVCVWCSRHFSPVLSFLDNGAKQKQNRKSPSGLG